MSFLRLLPKISAPPVKREGFNESIQVEEFVSRFEARLAEMQRGLDENEQLDVVAFLPSGQAISVEVIGYTNPSLVILYGREQESGKACTLLAHQSSIQVLVSIESIPSGSQRRLVAFQAE